jgi:hypothetical protein
LQIGPYFLHRPACTLIFLFYASCCSGMTGTYHQSQLFCLLRWGGPTNFIAWAGLGQLSSQSQPPKWWGLQPWATGTWSKIILGGWNKQFSIQI